MQKYLKQFQEGIYLLFVLFICPTLVYGQDYDQKLSALETYIENARKDWSLPGMAVAIVKDGKVLYTKGFGERKLGSGEKVNTKTIFNIGSTTKAFTATLVAMLVDEGKLNWDDPVVWHLPEFQLYDANASREARVKDLLTHNLGVGNADALWANASYSPDEILYRMRFLEPAYPLRGGYTYQNIMYLAAGLLIEKVTGQSWEDNIAERIFKPLGMKNSYATKALSQVEPNRSTAHHWIEGKVVPIKDFNCDSIAAAGSIWSCVEDLTQWSLFMLNEGKVKGKSLLSQASWEEMFKPQVIISKPQFYPTTALTKPKWTTYGLAWFQHDYFGKDLDFHTGSLPGTIALHGLMHEEALGYYFLGNLDHAELRHALMYKIFDLFGDTGNDQDWSADMKLLYGRLNKMGESSRANFTAQRKSDTETSKPLDTFVGTYTHKVWGSFKVTYEKGKLMLINGKGIKQALTHWHYDTFRIDPLEGWQFPSYCTFNLSVVGEIYELSLGEGYVFTKE